MNSSQIAPIAIHTVLILLIQVLLLLNVSFPLFGQYSLSMFIYPMIIIMLPIGLSQSGTLVGAFVIGVLLDFFYDSPGVHAATLVFTAFARPYILRLFEPRGGYRTDQFPTMANYGFSWFFSYASTVLFIHLIVYFAIDAFTLVYIDKILINAIVSFLASITLIGIYQLIIRH